MHIASCHTVGARTTRGIPITVVFIIWGAGGSIQVMPFVTSRLHAAARSTVCVVATCVTHTTRPGSTQGARPHAAWRHKLGGTECSRARARTAVSVVFVGLHQVVRARSSPAAAPDTTACVRGALVAQGPVAVGVGARAAILVVHAERFGGTSSETVASGAIDAHGATVVRAAVCRFARTVAAMVYFVVGAFCETTRAGTRPAAARRDQPLERGSTKRASLEHRTNNCKVGAHAEQVAEQQAASSHRHTPSILSHVSSGWMPKPSGHVPVKLRANPSEFGESKWRVR